jgi:hypothetical protein
MPLFAPAKFFNFPECPYETGTKANRNQQKEKRKIAGRSHDLAQCKVCVRPGNYASGVATTVTRLTPAIESFAESMCRRLNPPLLR